MTELKPYPEYKDSGVEWLGQVPVGWDVCAVGRFVRFRNGADYTSVEVEEGGYPVYGSGGEFRRASSYLFDGESVLFGRKGTIDRPLHVDGRFWTVDTMYYTDISTNHLLPRFIYYWAIQLPYAYWVTSTALPSMTQSDLASAKIPYTSLADQTAIVKFLDRETAEIDAFIADQEELIRLLTERRAATISHAVTKGTDSSVSVRDSGVPWLGEVPESWQTRPLWTLFKRIKDVGHPEEQMLSVFRELGVVVKDDHDNNNQTADNRNIYQLVGPGWLVTNRMKAWQGSVGISEHRGIVSGHYLCFHPTHSESSKYLNYLFRSLPYAAGYAALSRGVRIGQAEIDNDHYRLLPVLLPPLRQQVEIAAHIDREVEKIDAAIADARGAIALSRERRAALISAAVTGKIDVREHAHSGVA